MLIRRRLIKSLSLFPLAACFPGLMPGTAKAQDIPDFTQLKARYAHRLKKILAAGELPYVDIESSCHSNQVNIDFVAKSMDGFNIGLMALSADIGKGQFEKGIRFDGLSKRLLANYPDRFIPVGNGGQPPALTEAPDEFLDAQEKAACCKKNRSFLGKTSSVTTHRRDRSSGERRIVMLTYRLMARPDIGYSA